jgi:hypothetical protein
MAKVRDPLAKLRRLILAWPQTEERLSHGSPTFWGGKKTFASFHDNHHGDGRIAVWCKSSLELQGDLVDADPRIFFVPPYAGPSGWIGIRLDRDVDWGLVEGLLRQGYRSVAPRRALEQLDAADPADAAPARGPGRARRSGRRSASGPG